MEPDTQPEYSQEEILDFLKKRKGILDGVCISGGEPTLAPELPEFLSRIRELGYDVKARYQRFPPLRGKKISQQLT